MVNGRCWSSFRENDDYDGALCFTIFLLFDHCSGSSRWSQQQLSHYYAVRAGAGAEIFHAVGAWYLMDYLFIVFLILSGAGYVQYVCVCICVLSE